jgi:hypothetical protein
MVFHRVATARSCSESSGRSPGGTIDLAITAYLGEPSTPRPAAVICGSL